MSDESELARLRADLEAMGRVEGLVYFGEDFKVRFYEKLKAIRDKISQLEAEADDCDPDRVAERFGISPAMAAEIMWANDEGLVSEHVYIASQIDPEDDPTLDQVFTCEQGPDGKIRPVTFREVLYGNNPDAPAMGIMCSTPPCELNISPHRLAAGLAMAIAAVERPLPAKPNRAKRREERKRERQARKRGRR